MNIRRVVLASTFGLLYGFNMASRPSNRHYSSLGGSGLNKEHEYEAERSTARILLLDDTNKILLLKISDPTVTQVGVTQRDAPSHKWITIGGKVEEGENPLLAARRELEEETGILCENEDLRKVWYGEHILSWKGVLTKMKESFFLFRSRTNNVVTTSMTDSEKEVFKEFRWWSISELQETDETIIPYRLDNKLHELISEPLPDPDNPIIVELSTPSESNDKNRKHRHR